MNGALARLLGDLRGRDFVALMNHGDRGDGFVHAGGRQFLQNLGVTCREYHVTDDLSHMNGDVLLIYGAGTMARVVRTLPDLMTWIAPRFADIVLLPSSYDFTNSRVRLFSEQWNDKYTVFCRELLSLDTAKRARGKPRAILLGHDLSFHADVSRWAALPASGRGGLFRHDAEATFGRLPAGLDRSIDAAQGPDNDPAPLLEYIASFEEIHTDRIHAGIAAARMRRKVYIYQNSYFKNGAVFDHSLAGQPHVRFVSTRPFSFRQYLRVKYWRAFRPTGPKTFKQPRA